MADSYDYEWYKYNQLKIYQFNYDSSDVSVYLKRTQNYNAVGYENIPSGYSLIPTSYTNNNGRGSYYGYSGDTVYYYSSVEGSSNEHTLTLNSQKDITLVKTAYQDRDYINSSGSSYQYFNSSTNVMNVNEDYRNKLLYIDIWYTAGENESYSGSNPETRSFTLTWSYQNSYIGRIDVEDPDSGSIIATWYVYIQTRARTQGTDPYESYHVDLEAYLCTSMSISTKQHYWTDGMYRAYTITTLYSYSWVVS